MATLREQVIEFHQAKGQPVLEKPQIPDDARIRLRIRLISEEFFEMLRALGVPCDLVENTLQASVAGVERFEVDMPELADALADIDYVVEGTRLEFGIYGPAIAAEVHRANMDKCGPGGKIDEHGKALKPPDWQPPDIKGCLSGQGWEG